MKTNASIVKLGVAAEAEFPDSSAGDTPRSGYFLQKPAVGEPFIFHQDGDLSALRTSTVMAIQDESKDSIRFRTNNSIYQVTYNMFEDID